MTYQDEFAGRLDQARGAETGEGGDPNKPLLFRGGDGGGGDASASLASANSGGAERDGLEAEGPFSTDRNHPNPVSGETAPSRFRSVRGTDRPDTFEKEGLRGTVYREEHTRLVSGPHTAKPEDRGTREEVLRQAQDDELTPPSRLREGPGVGPGETASDASGSIGNPTPNPSREREGDSPTPRHDGWLPETRVKFLEALARTGNVQASAYYVQLSRQSAYDLRRRDPDFARAWLAALVLARDVAEDALQERAIEGIEEPVYYHGEVVGMRRRSDSRLLLAHLARLDKIAEQVPAQRGAARFGEMLEAIGKGEDTAPLIATPTDDELAAAAARAEAHGAPAEQGPEFYEIAFPDHDGPPDYYRMTPEEAAEMERETPGLTATPTGTADEATINAMHFEELARAEAAQKAAGDDRWPEKGDDTGALRI